MFVSLQVLVARPMFLLIFVVGSGQSETMAQSIKFTLLYEGGDADNHRIDFYDVSQALIGFQRSIALTTHLVLNNQIITQAPSLKGAEIFALPPENGSWKFTAMVTLIGSGVYGALTAERDTVLGHLVTSAYDYVISESLGFHVDFEKSLGQQLEEVRHKDSKNEVLTESRFDSLIEKCETAVVQMHRPIVENNTAESAFIVASIGSEKRTIGRTINSETSEYIAHSSRSEDIYRLRGRVSSYNANTFKGRIYIESEGRPIPFLLSDEARASHVIEKITNSLSLNAVDRFKGNGEITFSAYKISSITGRLKALVVVAVF